LSNFDQFDVYNDGFDPKNSARLIWLHVAELS